MKKKFKSRTQEEISSFSRKQGEVRWNIKTSKLCHANRALSTYRKIHAAAHKQAAESKILWAKNYKILEVSK